MTTRALNKHIVIRKLILNFLLNFFSPTTNFIVSLSQNLDLLVARRQRLLYANHRNKNCSSKSLKQLRKVA